jgi:hypothetical protein
MKTKNLTNRIVLFIGFCLCFFLFSCEKDYKPDLKSEHTIDVNIRGTLNVIPSGEKINDVLVEVVFVKGWGSQKVVSGKTKNGEFNFNVAIDTTTFNEYYMHISISSPANYITTNSSVRFYQFDKETLKNINFELYRNATLTIDLNRTETDDFEVMYVYHSFVANTSTMSIIRPDTPEKDRILQRVTAADVYTKITWSKHFKDNTTQWYADSLICRQKENNVYNINY